MDDRPIRGLFIYLNEDTDHHPCPTFDFLDISGYMQDKIEIANPSHVSLCGITFCDVM